jgi:hypothetical protein
MSEWINVKDRLPKENEEVLAFSITVHKEGYMSVAHWIAFDESEPNIITWFSFINEEKCITHWMPLPNPPEEK